jgi:hypothetical protein
VEASELMSKGKKLSGAEARTLLAASKSIDGVSTDSGSTYKMTVKPDGTYAGRSSTGFNFSGKWSINEKGQSCFVPDPPGKPSSEPCADHYELGDRIYVVTPSGKVLDRTINR